MNEMTPQTLTSQTMTPLTMTPPDITVPQKGSRLFYLFPALYVLSAYLMPFFFSQQENLPLLSRLMYAPIVFAVCNIIVSVKCAKLEYQDIMLNAMVLVKYAMIPFFILGGVLVAGCLLISFIPVPFMIFAGPVLAFVCAVIGWLLLAFGAPYTISYLCTTVKTGNGSVLLAVIHSLLQFFFVLDVFSVMYLALRAKRWRKLTFTLLALLAVVIILLFIFIVIGIFKLVL